MSFRWSQGSVVGRIRNTSHRMNYLSIAMLPHPFTRSSLKKLASSFVLAKWHYQNLQLFCFDPDVPQLCQLIRRFCCRLKFCAHVLFSSKSKYQESSNSCYYSRLSFAFLFLFRPVFSQVRKELPGIDRIRSNFKIDKFVCYIFLQLDDGGLTIHQ